MEILFDWILIVVSSILFFQSTKRLLEGNSRTVADYIMIVIYVFNCLPILLDYIFGIPNYLPWYKEFEVALINKNIRIIYSVYILSTIVFLYLYTKKRSRRETTFQYERNNSIFFRGVLLHLIILLPYFHIIFTGNLHKYFIYGTYSARGLTSSFYHLNTFLIFLSIFAFCCWFFLNKRKRIDYLLLLIYFLSIIWIDGKRYIIVIQIFMFMFFYNNSVNSQLKNISLKRIFYIFTILFFAFNYIYITQIKPMASNTFDSLYMSFRIDYGRDDVTKFVLYREFINDNPILDYRGQSLLSTIFMLIPREIWPTKPYPHYRYLTAELFGTSPTSINAGMTPSLFEMSVSNFGQIGMLITILFLIFSCRWIDNCKSVPRKALYLILLIGLLTQSLDALIAYYVIAPMSGIGSLIKRNLYKKKHTIIYQKKVNIGNYNLL